MAKIKLNSTLVVEAVRRLEKVGLTVTGLRENNDVARGNVAFKGRFGALALKFHAGKFESYARHEEIPPAAALSPLVNELLATLSKEEFTCRIAIFGRPHMDLECYLEVVLYVTTEGEAFLSMKMEDNHFDELGAERLRKASDLSGIIVTYSGEEIALDTRSDDKYVVLQIVWGGNLFDYVQHSGLDLGLGRQIGHDCSGVYCIVSAGDSTSNWGYLIIGDLNSAVRILDAHMFCHYVLMRTGTH